MAVEARRLDRRRGGPGLKSLSSLRTCTPSLSLLSGLVSQKGVDAGVDCCRKERAGLCAGKQARLGLGGRSEWLRRSIEASVQRPPAAVGGTVMPVEDFRLRFVSACWVGEWYWSRGGPADTAKWTSKWGREGNIFRRGLVLVATTKAVRTQSDQGSEGGLKATSSRRERMCKAGPGTSSSIRCNGWPTKGSWDAWGFGGGGEAEAIAAPSGSRS